MRRLLAVTLSTLLIAGLVTLNLWRFPQVSAVFAPAPSQPTEESTQPAEPTAHCANPNPLTSVSHSTAEPQPGEKESPNSPESTLAPPAYPSNADTIAGQNMLATVAQSLMTRSANAQPIVFPDIANHPAAVVTHSAKPLVVHDEVEVPQSPKTTIDRQARLKLVPVSPPIGRSAADDLSDRVIDDARKIDKRNLVPVVFPLANDDAIDEPVGDAPATGVSTSLYKPAIIPNQDTPAIEPPTAPDFPVGFPLGLDVDREPNADARTSRPRRLPPVDPAAEPVGASVPDVNGKIHLYPSTDCPCPLVWNR